MANVVASIMASLGLDARSFKAEIASVEKNVDAFGKNLLGISNLSGFLTVAGAGTAVKSLIDYGAEVQHLSDRYQVSTDAIQKFGNAAEQNGVSMESVARAFGKLEKAQAQALQGNDEMAAAFIGLGVSVGDLKSLSPDQLMEKIGHSSMNAADLVKILGRNGLELRPILKGLADGTIEYGKAIDAINIKRLEEADKTWKKLFETVRVLGAEFVGPKLEGIMNQFSDVKNIGSSAWDVIRNAATLNFSESGKAARNFFSSYLKQLSDSAKAFSLPGGGLLESLSKKIAPASPATPPKKTANLEELEEEGKRAQKIESARGENAVLEAQLNHLDAIAKALEIHFNIEKKIAEARAAGNSALVAQLQLQERLSIQKVAQEVAEKNRGRGQLSLHELAEAGPIGTGRFFSEATLRARRAQQEETLGERERLAQHPEAAMRHFDLAEQIKASIPQLRDSEKDISGQVRMGNESTQVFQELKARMDAILNLFSG